MNFQLCTERPIRLGLVIEPDQTLAAKAAPCASAFGLLADLALRARSTLLVFSFLLF
jgi:hypothetical protein